MNGNFVADFNKLEYYSRGLVISYFHSLAQHSAAMANVAATPVLRRRRMEARAKAVRREMAMMQDQSSGLRCLVVSKMAMMVVMRKKAISLVVGGGCDICKFFHFFQPITSPSTPAAPL